MAKDHLEGIYWNRYPNGSTWKIGHGDDMEARSKDVARFVDGEVTQWKCYETENQTAVEKFIHALLAHHRQRGKKEVFENLDDDLAAEAHELAVDYDLRGLPLIRQAAELRAQASDGTVLAPTSEDEARYWELRRLADEKARIEARMEVLVAEMKLRIGTCDGIDRTVTWKSSSFTQFCHGAFRDAHPEFADLYEPFFTHTFRRTFRLE